MAEELLDAPDAVPGLSPSWPLAQKKRDGLPVLPPAIEMDDGFGFPLHHDIISMGHES